MLKTFLHFILFIWVLLTNLSYPEVWKEIVDLHGYWKFEIGDNSIWTNPNFDDSSWEEIKVPSSWEDQGFPGYDGYAWYRIHFFLTIENITKSLYLHLGRIDDVDDVYLNGNLIGSTGSFPPNYNTAYHIHRGYILPAVYFNSDGNNVLAVRVFDERLAGGILEGRIGIYELQDELSPDIPLSGIWKFSPGDNLDWKEPDFDDNDWINLTVPGFWELQGFRNYDGFGWYRTKFDLDIEFENDKLILLLGKIDDIDECYLNGKRIGRTGEFTDESGEISFSEEYLKLRAYYIPKGLLNHYQNNTIAVRVFDGYIDGGIYSGPIGIVTREKYLKWLDTLKERKWNFLKFLFKKE
jgi:sialate O-acetylesterase